MFSGELAMVDTAEEIEIKHEPLEADADENVSPSNISLILGLFSSRITGYFDLSAGQSPQSLSC